MKLKSIFIVLLISMFLNIFHDFTIEHQINLDCCNNIELLEKSDKCHKIDIVHHFFHFFALELLFKELLFLRTQIKPIFDTEHPPLMVLDTSFKPPRS
jgi:hypothetical protein